MPATSVICIPEMVTMWKMPARRIRSLHIVRQEVALARHHCGGDGAGVVADDFIDPERQRVAQAIDGGEEAQRQRRGIRRRHRLDAPERAADAADPREIGVAREVVAAGQSGARRRQQPRLEGDEISRREAGRSPRRESHAGRDHVARQSLGACDAQHEARAGAAQVDLLDVAGQFSESQAGQDGSRDARRAPGAGGKARRDESEGEGKRMSAGVPAGEEGEQGRDGEGAEAQGERGFVVRGEIEKDAGASRDRAPEKRPAQFDFRRIGVFQRRSGPFQARRERDLAGLADELLMFRRARVAHPVSRVRIGSEINPASGLQQR